MEKMMPTGVYSRPSLEERFTSRIQKTEGCWLWRDGTKPKRYGTIWDNGRNVYAHRVSYQLHNGPIPSGLEIDHLCRNPSCVNPAHLEAVTHRVNIIRGGVHSNGANMASKTHCPQDHPYDLFNTVRGSNGERKCRECKRSYMKRYHQNQGVKA